MKQSLQLKLSQRLSLTPQLQQSIRLLQLSALEFGEELEKYLLENPLLEHEEEDHVSFRQVSTDMHVPSEPSELFSGADEIHTDPQIDSVENWFVEENSYRNTPGSFDEEEDDYQNIQVATTTLRDHLLSQLGLLHISERERNLVRYLIEALDDYGYLLLSLEELSDHAPLELQIEPDELKTALNCLQNFDPTGVGARNTRECLALQLAALSRTEACKLALKLIDHLDLLASRNFIKLKRIVRCSDDQLIQAQALIRSLNPRPGAQYAPHEAQYIIPDLIVRKIHGRWIANINVDTYPRLRINHLYSEILSRQRGSNLAGQLQEARWLIKNIKQRFETIQKVGQAIIDRQRRFLDYGEVAMKPLVLREIADVLELHESTVSRATTQKYMATPRGIFELKYFFGSHVATESGGACSATAIRAMIKQLIDAEPKKKPLSDGQISDLLSQQGLMVARRTVAKYREVLHIPPVKLRRAI